MFGPGGSADFAPLGEVEFKTPAAIHEMSETGRKVSGQSALIIMHLAHDYQAALLATAALSMGGNRNAKARRATRPLRRAAWHLRAAQRCFAITPRVFHATYERELMALRQSKHSGMQMDHPGS